MIEYCWISENKNNKMEDVLEILTAGIICFYYRKRMKSGLLDYLLAVSNNATKCYSIFVILLDKVLLITPALTSFKHY